MESADRGEGCAIIIFQGGGASIDELADELVQFAPDVFITVATPPAIAAKRATTTIPIVMATAGDPLSSGIVASLAHPGGNITGVTLYAADLSGKRLEIFKKAVPASARVAVLGNQKNPLSLLLWHETQAAAQPLGLDARLYIGAGASRFVYNVRSGGAGRC